MNTIKYAFLIPVFCTVFACSNQNNSTDSEIIQYQDVVDVPMDGPVQPIVLNTSIDLNNTSAETNPKLPKKRFVNTSPPKSLKSLKMEITFLEEQGATDLDLANLYFEYGNALVDSNNYKEAIDAFEVAEEFGFEESKTLYFKLARTYALDGNYYGNMEDYLLKARQNGFRNYRALLYDQAFEGWRNEYDFMYLYNELFGTRKKAMFKAFVTFAPKKSLTKDFIIDPTTLYENVDYEYRDSTSFYAKHPIINGFFEDFVSGVSDGMFSRDGGDNFRYEMTFANNKNYTAVIYSEEQAWAEYLLPKEYILVTFDKEGNKISELEIAKRGSLKKCKGVIFHPDNSLEVTNYKVAWNSGAKEKAFEKGNYMTHKDLKYADALNTQTYRINAIGRIVETDGLILGMK